METPNFTVTKIDLCPDCQGEQVIHDPSGFWAAFWNLMRTKPEASNEEFNQRFLDVCAQHGAQPDNPPIEETPCDCGTGLVRTEVPLAEALAALGYPAPDEIRDRLARIEKDVYYASNAASCLTNGMIPD